MRAIFVVHEGWSACGAQRQPRREDVGERAPGLLASLERVAVGTHASTRNHGAAQRNDIHACVPIMQRVGHSPQSRGGGGSRKKIQKAILRSVRYLTEIGKI